VFIVGTKAQNALQCQTTVERFNFQDGGCPLAVHMI